MKPVHVYVHVPFCSRRCSYCDFSIAVRRVTPVDEFLSGLEREMGTIADTTGALETVYLGGGTPSRLGRDGIDRVLSLLRDRFEIHPGAEITIEANPEDISAEAALAWRASGVNRVSIGVQSFDDSVLEWMHRVHDASTARRSVQVLRDAGIDNLSVDLIFALPASLGRSWKRDLDCVLELDPDHVSLYGLTVEEHTPLSRWESRGDVTRADDDCYAADFLAAHHAMTSSGLEHYEVSNFGKPGRRSRHNSAYWTGSSYLGLGPSAHSFDGESRWWNARAYTEWLAHLARNESPIAERETLTSENRNAERVYLGLRTDAGLAASEGERAVAGRWVSEGWADVRENVIRLTPEGWLRLDALASQLTVF